MSNENLSAFSRATGGTMSRRALVSGAVGLGALAALAACTGTGGGGGGTTASKTLTFGSGSSDDVPKRAYAAVVDGVQQEERRQGHHQHGRPQRLPEQHQHLPAGQPGRRVHLVRRLPDALLRRQGPRRAASTTSGRRSAATSAPASQQASTGDDGKKYFVPNYNYPWGFFYRKSVWQAKGYTVPATFDDLIALAKQMKADGLIPIAFADKDGWPAMGTFDYINMRTTATSSTWTCARTRSRGTSRRSRTSSTTGSSCSRTSRPTPSDSPGRRARRRSAPERPGMYLLGSFVTQQFTDPAVLADIDFFPFPEIAVEGTDAVEAPIDGLMLSKKGGDNQAAHGLARVHGHRPRARRPTSRSTRRT